MKKTFIFLSSLVLGLAAGAQKIEQYFDYAWRKTEDIGTARYYALIEKKDTLWLRKDYFLQEKRLQMTGSYRDEETKVAEGAFRYFHPNGRLQSEGSYVNGKKQGLWLGYYDDGVMKDSIVYEAGAIVGTTMSWHHNAYTADSGVYRRDGSGVYISWFDNGNPSSGGLLGPGYKRVGKWKFFHRNGNPSGVEVYENGTLTSKQYFDEDGKPQADTTAATIDHDASFPGGPSAWKKYLSKKMYFPDHYKIVNSDQAVVVVDWTIDEDGNVVDVVVTSPLHPDFDRMAAEAIRKSPRWMPAVSHNRRIKSYRSQPVTFTQ